MDCDKGVYYSSQEHLNIARCDGGNTAPLCPRHWTSSLCQCALPTASQDLYEEDVTLQVSLNFKFLGFVAFALLCVVLSGMKVARRCRGRGDSEEEVTFSEAELAFLSMESSNYRGGDDDDDDISASSMDVLLKKEKRKSKSGKLKKIKEKENEGGSVGGSGSKSGKVKKGGKKAVKS